ncbi:MAG TPA: glycosyltransferase family 39 protein, partial [Polyangia bacterium]
MWPRALAAVAVAVAYLAMAPVVVNGDGLGYLKAALAGTLYPGHLAYVPLLAAVGKLVGATRPVELLWPARIVSALAAAKAAWLVGDVARRRFGERAAWAAMLGFAVSWGVLSEGSDVESYAPALAALVAALWCADRQRPVASGLLCAAATLFHVENVLFVPVCALVVERRRALVVAAAALPVAAAYALVLPAHGVAWLAGASHGLRYPLRWSTPFVAVYGACKALVYSPYPYEASWA